MCDRALLGYAALGSVMAVVTRLVIPGWDVEGVVVAAVIGVGGGLLGGVIGRLWI